MMILKFLVGSGKALPLLSRSKLTVDSVYETLRQPIFQTGDVALINRSRCGCQLGGEHVPHQYRTHPPLAAHHAKTPGCAVVMPVAMVDSRRPRHGLRSGASVTNKKSAHGCGASNAAARSSNLMNPGVSACDMRQRRELGKR